MKRLVILGSTGSIGRSTLDVVRMHPERYTIVGLAAGSDGETLRRQAHEFGVELLALARPGPDGAPEGVALGPEAPTKLVRRSKADIVVNGISGAAGFLPSLAAIEHGAALALANKESLVIGGSFLTRAAREKNVPIIPVDSEHSAIFQCLQGEGAARIRRILLTASGGPFRERARETFAAITPAEALSHPTWDMGPRITVDSATMMNKALEIIEASWLFPVPFYKIEVCIHPQSIVHSLVEFEDTSIKAQLSPPDMRLAIAYALSWPERVALDLEPLDLSRGLTLDFLPPDEGRFPALGLAKRAMQQPDTLPCIMNAADEVAVAAFLEGRIRFDQITMLVERTMHTLAGEQAGSPEDIIALDKAARSIAQGLTSC